RCAATPSVTRFCGRAWSCRRPKCRPPRSASARLRLLCPLSADRSPLKMCGAYTRPPTRETGMPETRRIRPTASVPPPMPPLLMPQPTIAPLVPPVHVVDLMTAEGSAAFGARWRAKEVKIVECPALTDSMPEFKTTYDIEPHAEELGFDDS